MRSVTKQAVKEARLKEIKQELLNSEKLKVSCSYPDAAEDLRKRFGIGWFFFIWCFILFCRPISRTTPEICSCSDTTKTSILLWSNPT